jgi:hypothetical protein
MPSFLHRAETEITRSSALPPTMRMHMSTVQNKNKVIEPIIQNMFLPSFMWRFIQFLSRKKCSEYFESGNALIFLVFYDLLASMNWFPEGNPPHKRKNTGGKFLHCVVAYCFQFKGSCDQHPCLLLGLENGIRTRKRMWGGCENYLLELAQREVWVQVET